MSATEMLAATSQQAAVLRDTASLDAAPDELRAAAERGELVARTRLKVHTEVGPSWYAAGETLPALPAEHQLLSRPEKLLTTVSRWNANHAWKELTAKLEGTRLLQAKLRNAGAELGRRQSEVDRLKAELATATGALKAAEKEQAVAELALIKALESADLAPAE